MFKLYYFNKSTDPNGRNEVHTEDCKYIEPYSNREYIGYFDNCRDALEKAKEIDSSQEYDGCFWCSYDCHKG